VTIPPQHGSRWSRLRPLRLASIGVLAIIAVSTPVLAGGRQASNPCAPRKRVLEAARSAAGVEYRQDSAPLISREGNTCVVTLWRIPKVPGGFRTVTVGAEGKVLRVDRGM
jgi:hypothetical protein